MTPPHPRPVPGRVVVVGAGISGLATAHHLLKAASPDRPVEVSVLEAAGRAGGKLWTFDLDGLPLEAGADSFVVRKPWAVQLCNELGLEDQVVIPGSMGAYVWSPRGLVPYPDRAPFGIPGDVGELLGWQGLGRGAKLRALLDLVKPARKGGGDEALGALLRRRLGPGVARTMVEPLLAGLHAADPMRLSVAAAFPELMAWERQYGSLLRGARAATKAAREEQGRQPIFATVWGGLSRLVERLVRFVHPDRIHLDLPVSVLRRDQGGLCVEAGDRSFHPDAVVLATPAFESARLLAGLVPDASRELAAITYASTAAVYLVYPEGTAGSLPEGSGFVVPYGRGTVTACTWVSRKWPNEAFGDRAVLRCFVGRAGDQDAPGLEDAELVERVAGEAEEALGLHLRPEITRVIRWHRSMPQYEVGHLDRVARIEAALAAGPGVFVTGSALGGIGIADCIRHGRETAERVADFLTGREAAEIGPTDEEQEAISWTS